MLYTRQTLQMPIITSVCPYFGNPCCTFALPSVSYKNLVFLLCQPKDSYPSRAEGKLFGRLASVLWILCACLVALAIRDFAYCVQAMLLAVHNCFYFFLQFLFVW